MHKRVLIPYRHERKVRPYEDAARAGGVEPVPILTAGAVSLEGFAGLLLIGGTDVNPKRYGEAAHAETDQPDDERDEVELELIDQAIEKDLPIFAICRGLQILNVYHGGTLIQHLPDQPSVHEHGGTDHHIKLRSRSKLARYLQSPGFGVTSIHHQAISRVGDGLVATAWAFAVPLVTLFPAAPLGGPEYVKALTSRMPEARLVVAGNVGPENIVDYFAAGAFAIAVGSRLFAPADLQYENYTAIAERARGVIRLAGVA